MGGSDTRGKILFVNRFFYPDHSATAQILADLTAYLVRDGFQVEVICSRLSYSDPSLRFEPQETWNGVEIVRVATTGFGRQNLLGRFLDYVSFYISCLFCVLKRARRGDTVVVKTDPPLLSVPIGLAARLKRARVINWLQDLFPEVGAELGLGLAKGPVGSILRWLRNRSLRKAQTNVAIGRLMAERLAAENVPERKIAVVPNFSDDEALVPDPDGWRTLRRDWGFADTDFVVGYSGNLGRAHDVDTVLDAASDLKDRPHIKFLFVGGGHLKSVVERVAAERSLTNILFRPYQPRDRLAQSLSVPDLHWVSLKSDLEGLIVPSKLYGIAAVGKPVLMIGDPKGEIATLAAEHGFGLCVEIGARSALTSALIELSDNQDKLHRQGQAARTYIDTHASRAHAFQRWGRLLQSG
ncbi:MAG: glycosyltransferase family 4 protein [Henriciella sp.]|nr:glycosyltransferase family 4 protein [Henriciella sp.]